jgi:hypothetical protein
VSPIFVDNNNEHTHREREMEREEEEEKKDYQWAPPAVKRKSKLEKNDDYCYKFCWHPSTPMFVYLC